MRVLFPAAALFLFAAAPAFAEDYYDVMGKAKHGNGYVPATIVAGWVKLTSYSVLAFVNDGNRASDAAVTQDWKVVMTTAPKAPPKDDEGDDDPRYAGLRQTNPQVARPKGPAEAPVIRREVTYSSLTCPAIAARMAALKPLTSFDYNPPSRAGNQDGPNGDGHQGFDLWVRIGDGELTKTASVTESKLGQWFQETKAALAACPAAVTPTP